MSTNDEAQLIEEPALPTTFGYSVQVYQAMMEEAQVEALGPEYGDDEGLVYDGFMTKLIQGLDLPVPYYTKILGELKRMDCVRQLRRGGSTTTSRWLLIQEPTPELFRKMPEDRTPKGKQTTDQRINDLNRRLGKVEEVLGLS